MSFDIRLNANSYQSGNVEALNNTSDISGAHLTTDVLSTKSTQGEDNLVECNIDDLRENKTDIIREEYYQTINEYYKLQLEMCELEKKRSSLKIKIASLDKDNKDVLNNLQARLSDLNSNIGVLKQSVQTYRNALRNLNIQMLNAVLENNNTFNVDFSAGTAFENSVTNVSDNNFSNDSMNNAAYNKTIPNDVAAKLDRKLGEGFTQKCEAIAAKVNCNTSDLLAMMYSESGLNPRAKNTYGGAVGLIQFMPSTLAANGYSSSQVANMSAIEQLDVVGDILSKSKAISGFSANDKLDTGSLYAICFLPAAAKNEVLCSSSGSLNWAYKANSALDLNSDGAISKSDLANRLNKKYKEMCSSV